VIRHCVAHVAAVVVILEEVFAERDAAEISIKIIAMWRIFTI
jgi:hypothetical protein